MCNTCKGGCCEQVDFCDIADFYYFACDKIYSNHLVLDLYPGLQIPLKTVFEIVEWIKFFGFEERTTDELFRCQYHNQATGKCMFYQNRPHFCQVYSCSNFKRYERKE